MNFTELERPQILLLTGEKTNTEGREAERTARRTIKEMEDNSIKQEVKKDQRLKPDE